MNGIICANKPSGWTSFDVVAKVRGMAKTRKVGHSGTLDPMATGVLPLFFGTSTKACDLMPTEEKGYIATFRFGTKTDTLDITGKVLEQVESNVTSEQVLAVLPEFRGSIEQIPPMFSAVQVNGRRLYDMARKGKEIERKPRSITIEKLELISFDEDKQECEIEVVCSKGTYIRSLCSDIGDTLKVGAVLTELVRNRAGCFTLSDCYSMEELQGFTDAGILEEKALPVEQMFVALPKISLTKVQSTMFRNGVKLELSRMKYENKTGFHRVFDEEDKFIGLASLDMETMELIIEKMFAR